MPVSPILPPGDLAILLAIADDPVGFVPPDQDSRLRVHRLAKEKYIWKKWDSPGYVVLPKGRDAISADAAALASRQAEEEAAKKQAQECAKQDAARSAEKAEEKKRSWRQFWLGLFLGWLIGWVTPGDVLCFLVDLFQ